MRTLLACVLLGTTLSAGAATEPEIRQAFDKAQKKGAVAIMQERCGSPTSVYFPGASAAQIAKTSAALAALAATRKDSTDAGECSGGMHESESRVLELYPDGTVKAR